MKIFIIQMNNNDMAASYTKPFISYSVGELCFL